MNTNEVESVPTIPPVTTQPPAQTRIYTLTMSPANGQLGLRLVPPAGVPQDHPLQLNVPATGCRFVIKLDTSSWNWKFNEPNIELGLVSSKSTPPRNRYYALTGGGDEVAFNAILNASGPEGNVDPFNIYISFMEGDNPVLLTIDPDILNPGDHP